MINTPVSLLDLYPTLLELCKLPAPTKQKLDGIDLVPLLNGERSERGQPVLSAYGPGNHSLTDGRFRYIRYADGDNELYDHEEDPYEWNNLDSDPKLQSVKIRLAQALPKVDAPRSNPDANPNPTHDPKISSFRPASCPHPEREQRFSQRGTKHSTN